jgi:hypothetical protein
VTHSGEPTRGISIPRHGRPHGGERRAWSQRGERTKTARALTAAVIGSTQLRALPEHAPDHDRNRQPFAGVAESRSGTNDGNAAEHLGRHVTPERELLTLPRPVTATVRRNTVGAKSAETLAPGFATTLHGPAPVQAPVQRTSFAPALGVALRPRRVPPFQVVVHVCPHCMPGTSAVIAPGPVIVTVSGC